MKRIDKKNKYGFTLLEVMLATVIMTIASTMIMQGFIAVMIMAKNNARYAKSGEENYRRAINETIVHYATAANQQTGVMEPLGDGKAVTLTASFAGANPSMVTAGDLNLCVDVTQYSDSTAPTGTELDSDAVEASTLANNRYAFFYDMNDFLGIGTNSGRHIYRWGYVLVSGPTDGHANSCIKVDDQWRQYGWYCFNGSHGEVTVTDDEGNESTSNCRSQPKRWGHVS
jgi:prepilin-type N-terminal cleavage/methylation domain-containing protein